MCERLLHKCTTIGIVIQFGSNTVVGSKVNLRRVQQAFPPPSQYSFQLGHVWSSKTQRRKHFENDVADQAKEIDTEGDPYNDNWSYMRVLRVTQSRYLPSNETLFELCADPDLRSCAINSYVNVCELKYHLYSWATQQASSSELINAQTTYICMIIIHLLAIESAQLFYFEFPQRSLVWTSSTQHVMLLDLATDTGLTWTEIWLSRSLSI